MIRQGSNMENPNSLTLNVEFSCGLCPDGMVGNGIDCSRTDPCESNPCYPGATCTMIVTSPLTNESYTDVIYDENLGNP